VFWSGSHNSLKGKDCLVCCSFGDWPFQHVRRREIDRNAEKVGEAIFKADHIKQGQLLCGINVRNQINIEYLGFSTRDGPMQGADGRFRRLSVPAHAGAEWR
jgi:hypothetical protein